MMGGPDDRPNYLKASCRGRIANRSCKVKSCAQRGGEVTEVAEHQRVNGTQKRSSGRKAAKKVMDVCACGCGRKDVIRSRGFIDACYVRFLAYRRAGREHEFGPPGKRGAPARHGECTCGCGVSGKLVKGLYVEKCYQRYERLRRAGRVGEFGPPVEKKGRLKGVCSCGCKREGELTKGLISSCYNRLKALEKAGRGHEFGPPGPRGRFRKDKPQHLARAQEQQKPLEQLPGVPQNAVTIFFPEVEVYILEELRKQAEKAGTDVAEDIKSVLHLFVCGDLVIKEG